jgi:hypothetical protein
VETLIAKFGSETRHNNHLVNAARMAFTPGRRSRAERRTKVRNPKWGRHRNIVRHSLLLIVPAGRKKRVGDASGNLQVPDAYRTSYQSLGSRAVGADQGPGAKELKVVYASPGTIAAYRRNGSFPYGAVLVKEVFETATGKVTAVRKP